MTKPLKFVVYELHVTLMREDWTDVNNLGALKPTDTVVDSRVVSDSEDRICIGGYGKDGKYYQFDSSSAWNVAWFFEEDFDLHGLWIESYEVKIPMGVVKKYVD